MTQSKLYFDDLKMTKQNYHCYVMSNKKISIKVIKDELHILTNLITNNLASILSR